MRSEGLYASTSTCFPRRQLTNYEYQNLIKFEDHKLILLIIIDLEKWTPEYKKFVYPITWVYKHASILHPVSLLGGIN